MGSTCLLVSDSYRAVRVEPWTEVGRELRGRGERIVTFSKAASKPEGRAREAFVHLDDAISCEPLLVVW
ncbi:MAG: hypothetical protein ACYCXN_06685 [Acidimicrobiales bacterium]